MKNGVDSQDIRIMGGWNSTRMLEKYIRGYQEEEAQKKYISPLKGYTVSDPSFRDQHGKAGTKVNTGVFHTKVGWVLPGAG